MANNTNLVIGLLAIGLILPLASADWIYQESSANYSVSGAAWLNESYLYDGDWNTYASHDSSDIYNIYSFYTANYTLPPRFNGTALWQIKDSSGTYNETLNADCLTQTPIQVAIMSRTNAPAQVVLLCWNGATWITQHVSTGDDKVYEDGMWWDPPDAPITTSHVYCPTVTCTNTPFTVWATYDLNGLPITNGTVQVLGGGTYDMPYSTVKSRYESQFTSNTPEVWSYYVTGSSDTGDTFQQSCNTTSYDCFNLSIDLYQEVRYKVVNGQKVRSYDKQANSQYINDFAYIIAKNNDHNVSGLNNDSCNLPIGIEQRALEVINAGNWMGDNLTGTIKNMFGKDIGCDNYWFRGQYQSGTATISLPWTGNYSLWLLDGTMLWNNEFSPPDIIKSDVFLPLGDLQIDHAVNQAQDYWVSQQELSFWGSFLSSIYLPMLLAIPLLLIGLSIVYGFPFRLSIIIGLGWMVLWTILRIMGG